jgi:hypothetical protein
MQMGTIMDRHMAHPRTRSTQAPSFAMSASEAATNSKMVRGV